MLAADDRSGLPAGRRPDPVVGIYHPEPETMRACLAPVVPETRLLVCTSDALLPSFLDDVDVLLASTFKNRVFPRESILRARRLQWLHLASAGVEYVLPLRRRGPLVTNSAGLHGATIADYVMAVVLDWWWGFPHLREAQRERRWAYRRSSVLQDQTMGILGLGHVGMSVAARARAFGMRTIGTRRTGLAVPGADRVYAPDETREMLAAADVIVVSLPLTDRTRGLLDASRLASVRRGAYLVAVSRGGIVDETALVAVLKEGRLAGAALDVFEREPLPEDSPLWSAPNLTVTPHISGALANSSTAVARLFLANLDRWTRGETLQNVVDPEHGY